ncbi:MAG: DUF2905 domain-containing protein [Deltaproteobacteria bacterium]|nr:DUF2905 domain-containing protein [Deltaproteobacteria bacterium]
MPEIGRALIVLGVVLVVVGALVVLFSRTGIPFGLGRLPGDILIQRENSTFYFPITTSIVVSVVVSLILYWLRR